MGTCKGSQAKVDDNNRSKLLPSQAFCPSCRRTFQWNRRTRRIPTHKVAPEHPTTFPTFREYP